MSRRHKFVALTWPERVLLFQALLMLPLTAVAVQAVGVKRWQRALARLSRIGKGGATLNCTSTVSSTSTADVKIQTARKIARLVRAAANHGPYRANCLHQSLVLWSLLKRSGLDSEVRFGARKDEGELKAHAWVECLGVALNEDRGVDQRFAPFAGAAATSIDLPLTKTLQSR